MRLALLRTAVSAVTLCLLLLASNASAQWPNNPGDDPMDALPNDPGYIGRDGNGNITGGQWNLWSFTPDNWDVVAAERALGVGLHADRAWQITPGDKRVVIAVLDSGIKWDERDLNEQYYLNRGELEAVGATAMPLGPPMAGGDDWDINGDGVLTVGDYLVNDRAGETTRLDANENGLLEGQDFIIQFSDGTDGDSNGWVDDVSGWDCMNNDNDPYDDTRFGHGTGEAKDSAGMGNNGISGIGVCPGCSILNVRVGDSFLGDVNDFAEGVIFSVDSGASVIQEAYASVNMNHFTREAIEYAYQNNVVIIATAADELSFHHNMPGTTNHMVYVHAVTHDKSNKQVSSTFLNFNNCTNYGGQLQLSAPGEGCSSEAVGVTSGHAGLIYSAAIGPQNTNVAGGIEPLDPPLSAEEVRQLLIASADDINVAGSANDPTKFPSGPGWDWHFGYGRNNARTSLDMIVAREIPPEADIISPRWFEVLWPDNQPMVAIDGRVGTRVDGLDPRYDTVSYTLEWAPGVDPKGGWQEIASQTDVAPFAGTLGMLDLQAVAQEIDVEAPAAFSHDDTITLRLTVSAMAPNGNTVEGEMRKSAHVHSDPDLHDGFPLWLNGASFESSPKFFDIDGDGADELIFGDSEGLVHAIKADGSEADGFPLATSPRRGHVPGEADSLENVCAFQAEGAKPAGCKVTNGQVEWGIQQPILSTVAIGDLEGDGSEKEIVALSYDGFAYAWRTDGTLLDGFPVRTDRENSLATDRDNVLDEGFFASPTLFDIDDDGDLEILASSMDQHLYVWHHDGSSHSGFPVHLQENDPLYEPVGARGITTPAVGDIDLDGRPEILVTTNEVYDDQFGRYYIVDARGNEAPDGPFEGGGPFDVLGLTGEVLPLVGRGAPTSPVIGNIDTDPYLEFTVEGIAGRPTFRSWDGESMMDEVFIFSGSGGDFGELSNSTDSGALPLLSNGSLARLDQSGSLAYVKGTAGYGYALAFAGGGEREDFDHQITAWNSSDGKAVIGFPQVVDDWQFIAGPTAADIDADGNVEVLVGTGGYRVFAFNYEGVAPTGWPKFTGGWVIASPAIGDLDGDGNLDIAVGTRNGWLYAWSTEAPTDSFVDWKNYGHDLRNTQNYEEPFAQPGDGPDPMEPMDTADMADAGDADQPDPSDDVGMEVTMEDSTDPGDSDSGCCSTVRHSERSPYGGALVLLILGLVAVWRRRR